MPRATYETVPYLSGSPAVFRNLFRSAPSAIQRVAYIGDSQETNPGGAGGAYLHRLNSLAFHMFGPPSETVVSNMTGALDQFVVRTQYVNFSGAASNYTNNQMAGKPLTAMSGTSEGYAVMLRPRSEDTGIAVSDDKELFFPIAIASLRAKVWFAGNSSGPNNARIYYQPGSTPSPGYYGSVAATHITSGLNLSTIGNNAWTSYETPELAYDSGNPYPQITVQGWNGSAVTTGLVCGGARFRDANRNEGLIFDTFSVGGYTAQDFIDDHATAYNQFNEYGPYHCIFTSFGTNECGFATTEEAFKATIIDLIELWRGTNWALEDVPVVLIADPPRQSAGTNATGYATFLRNAAIFAEIAGELDNVLAINGTRLMDEAGYDPATDGDGVHPNDEWNAIRAELIWRQMLNSFLLPMVPSTCRVRFYSIQNGVGIPARLFVTSSLTGRMDSNAFTKISFDGETDETGFVEVDLPYSSLDGVGAYRFRLFDLSTGAVLHDRTCTVPDEASADYGDLVNA